MPSRGAKKTAGDSRASGSKVVHSEPESPDESGSDSMLVEKVQTVKKFKPAVNIDLVAQGKLDKMLITPVLQAALTGASDEPFLVILIKKRFGNNAWTTIVRDRIHSSHALEFNSSLNADIEALSVPALMRVNKFSVTNEQNEMKLIVNGFASVSTSVELANYMAKKLPFPTLLKSSVVDIGKTEKTDVFDLAAGQRNIELDVEISNAQMREKTDGMFFLTFDCQDHTGTLKGVAWENVDVLSGILKNGATVNIKKPVVKKPDAAYTARYTSKMEITIGKNTQVKAIRK